MEIPWKYHPRKAFVECDDPDKDYQYELGLARVYGTGRQNLKKAYYGTGGLYIFKTENIKAGHFYGMNPTIYELDSDEFAMDVNEIEDIDEIRCRIAIPCHPDIKTWDDEAYIKLCKEYEK